MKSRRLHQLNIRVTSEEKNTLETRARKLGFRSVADYLRAAILTGAPPTERTYSVKIHPGDPDEGGFWAEVPALPGCNTQGQTYEETLVNATRAIEGYLKMLIKLQEPIPIEKQPHRLVSTAVKVAV
jgi:predicted RNase H-like HicB family nuclease